MNEGRPAGRPSIKSLQHKIDSAERLDLSLSGKLKALSRSKGSLLGFVAGRNKLEGPKSKYFGPGLNLFEFRRAGHQIDLPLLALFIHDGYHFLGRQALGLEIGHPLPGHLAKFIIPEFRLGLG